MISQRNHEGYHDPTAAQAIRRAHRAKRRGKSTRSVPLTFKVGDLPGFLPHIRQKG